MDEWYAYEKWAPRADWANAGQGGNQYERIDFHVDIGCGKIPKARIGIDRHPAPGVNVVAELDTPHGPITRAVPSSPGQQANLPWSDDAGLPFLDSRIESVISHHAMEHIGEGFLLLMDEIYRVLKPGGIFMCVTPLFPSTTAVEDPDHCRYFMEGTWDAFCGTPGDEPNQCWQASFSVPYTKARFTKVWQICSPRTAPEAQWTAEDRREIRVALRAEK